jgi:hypothetical protein
MLHGLTYRPWRIEMALWCKQCGAFMGLREPLHDWSTDRTGLCISCAPTQTELAEHLPDVVPKPPTDEDMQK